MVTVTSAAQSAPTVFPLAPCGSGGSDMVTLGCLATGFNPSSITFSWEQGSTSLNNFIQYPSIQKGNEYLGISQVQVSRQDWDARKAFKCIADHSGQKYHVQVTPPPPPPKVYELPTVKVCSSVDEGKDEAYFSCFAKDFSPNEYEITWLRDDQVINGAVDEVVTSSQGRNDTNGTILYSVASLLTLPSRDVPEGAKLTCLFKGKGETNSPVYTNSTVSHKRCSAVTEGCSEDMDIRIIPPTNKDIFVAGKGTLICEVTEKKAGFEKVVWLDEDDREVVFTLEKRGSNVHLAKIEITFDEWSKGLTRVCEVHSTEWLDPVKKVYTRNDAARSIPPNINLYPVWNGEFNISNVRLVCALRDYFPKDLTVEWYKENQLLTSKQDVKNFISANEENRTYTQTTEIIPDKEDWMKGSIFKCKSIHKAKNSTETINICQIYGKYTPPIYMEIPNFMKVMTESEVEAKCSVSTVLNANLTWEMDGVPVQHASLTRNDTFVSTALKLSSETWAKKKTIQCKAEHLCFSATKTINISGPPVTSPQVEIRRSFSELLKGQSAVFQCDVSQLSPQDLYVTFQVNGADASQKHYIDLPEGSGPHSVSRSFSVPTVSWKSDTNVSCTVTQGYSRSLFKSNLMSGIFVKPSVELLLSQKGASDQQTLLCSGWGFNPDIKWRNGLDQISTSNDDFSMDANGRVVVTSQLKVDQTQWKSGKVFTCVVSDKSLNEVVKKEISVCSACSSPPPNIELDIPKTVTSAPVKATCVVHTALDATVTWLTDGIIQKKYTMTRLRNITHLAVDVTVPSVQWKQMKTIACRAEHSCFSPTEKTVNVAGPSVTRPQVEIRRSFSELQKGQSAVFQCDVSQLSSQHTSVTFQVNGADASQNHYIDLPEGSGPHSVSRSFSVPTESWKSDTNVSCTVTQGYSSSPLRSNLMSGIFVEPSVEVHLAPSKGFEQQILVCSGRGFNPLIKWFNGSKEINPANPDVSMNNNGLVAVMSQLHVGHAEWKRGVVFTCEVSDTSLKKNVKKGINVCSVMPKSSHMDVVYIQRPKLEEVQKRGRVTVTCLFVGTSFCDFSIIWKVGDHQASPSDINMEKPVSHNNGTETLHSSLYVSAEDWHSNKQVSCEGKHLCSNKSYIDHISKNTDLYPPVLRIVEPTFDELHTSDSVTLTCLVSAFFPSDIIVQWRENGQQLPASRYINSPSWKEPGTRYFSMRSRLNVTKAENNNSTYSCVVRHESSETPFETSISDMFATVRYTKPSAVLLQGENELMCLVSGFNPKSINITWFRSETTELSDYNVTEPYIGPDRKFSILSRLRLAPIDTLPGMVITCRVTYEGATVSVNISEPDTLDNCNFFDAIKDTDVSQDTMKETWTMALTFLCFFLFTIIFSLVVLIVKTK